MPAFIVPTPDDPNHSRGVAYARDPHRPAGNLRPSGATRPQRLIPDPRFVLGLDLGQAHDHTAMVAVERRPGRRYAVPLVTRAPLGTPYPRIVQRVAETAAAPPFTGACHLVADATGVGRPVLDMLRAGPLPPVAVTITGGDAVQGGGYAFRVPKRDLVTALQLAFQSGRLEISAGTDHAETLIGELGDFRVRITAGGSDQYGAWREGAHDDLVFALALAVWWGDVIAARGRASASVAMCSHRGSTSSEADHQRTGDRKEGPAYVG